MSLINGTGTSKFTKIITDDSSEVTSYEFPLCNENGGLKESWQEKYIEHELLSYKLVRKFHGYRIIWDFNFDDWADGDTLIKFRDLKNSLDNGSRWKLIPRNDEQFQLRAFEVICTSDNFDIILDSGMIWHTGFHIQFSSKELVNSIDWTLIVPEDTLIYPYGDEGFEEVLYET